MDKWRSRFVPGVSFEQESLERRMVLSGIGSAGALPRGAAEIAAQVVRKATTVTKLAASAGTLGQPITFTVTVRAAAAAGAPTGTVDIVDHGTVIQTLTLSPMSSPNSRYAMSQATVTLTQPPGGSAYYFGNHPVSALFLPSGAYAKSTARATFNVSQPTPTTLAGGVKISTVVPGSGPEIQAGQTAHILYAGYLAKTGEVFDDSIHNGGAPLAFTLGAGQVVPGFDAGVAGMQVGETRLILIPPAQGYGATTNGPIPGNSTLIFEVTLASIS